MGKHIEDEDIENICQILDAWDIDNKLTWDRLVRAVSFNLGFVTTRQTLQSQARIKMSYRQTKSIICGNAPRQSNVPPSLKIATERLEKQARTIQRLEEENRQLLAQFQVWLYNAWLSGISPEMLNQPLPDRSR
ncbi:hypothetical protein [Buttiauxella gaviniae]|uniref:hypothetical protein n=1 Tax=Buttiauxella gaviniae TaxID=82990 RepID=UPI0039754EF8